MKWLNTFLGNIPKWLSSRVSIFIYLFLFFYLVIFALVCLAIPSLHDLIPTNDTQLILGNYTNVLSALGASIAAGSGVVLHKRIKTLHDNHEKLQQSLDEIHKKIDKLSDEAVDRNKTKA